MIGDQEWLTPVGTSAALLALSRGRWHVSSPSSVDCRGREMYVIRLPTCASCVVSAVARPSQQERHACCLMLRLSLMHHRREAINATFAFAIARETA